MHLTPFPTSRGVTATHSRTVEPPIPTIYNLVGFSDFNDEGIEQLRLVFHSIANNPLSALVTLKDEVTFESSSEPDDREWEDDDLWAAPGPKIIAHPMKDLVPRSTMMSSVKKDSTCSVSFLIQMSSKRQMLSDNRSLAVGFLHTGGVMILFSEIGKIFDVSETTIEKRYRRSQA
jgi:hypothetical protein